MSIPFTLLIYLLRANNFVSTGRSAVEGRYRFYRASLQAFNLSSESMSTSQAEAFAKPLQVRV